jgi:hypothetical protein
MKRSAIVIVSALGVLLVTVVAFVIALGAII